MTDAVTAEPRAIHRTFLADDGRGKRAMPDGPAKRMLGGAKGTVIRLSPDEQVTIGLGLSEGIEEGLTALNVGWSPVWAAGSANGMADFPVLGGIECLTLFADHGDAGEEAADECARRWVAVGREANVRLPKGADWNATLRGELR